MKLRKANVKTEIKWEFISIEMITCFMDIFSLYIIYSLCLSPSKYTLFDNGRRVHF